MSFKVPENFKGKTDSQIKIRMDVACKNTASCKNITSCDECLFDRDDITEEQKKQFLEWEKENEI